MTNGFNMKNKIMNKVRKAYDLPSKTTTHFTKDEMMHIVERITGKEPQWDNCQYFFEEELSDYGWISQETVDTHPSIDNLFVLLSLKNKMNSQKEESMNWIEFLTRNAFDPKKITINKNQIVIDF
jgi:hypothetical protein